MVMATRSDDGVANLRFGKQQVFPHHRHQRGDAKPAEEAQEKGEPGQVEGPHLRGGQAEQVDASCFGAFQR